MTWKPEESLEEQVAGGADRLRESLGIPADMQLGRPRARFTAAPSIMARYGWTVGPQGPINGVTGFDVTRYADGSLQVELLGGGVTLADVRYPPSDRLDSVTVSVAAPSGDGVDEGQE